VLTPRPQSPPLRLRIPATGRPQPTGIPVSRFPRFSPVARRVPGQSAAGQLACPAFPCGHFLSGPL